MYICKKKDLLWLICFYTKCPKVHFYVTYRNPISLCPWTSSSLPWPLDCHQRSMIAGCRGQGQRALIQSILGPYRNELATVVCWILSWMAQPECCSKFIYIQSRSLAEERGKKTFSCYMSSGFPVWSQQCWCEPSQQREEGEECQWYHHYPLKAALGFIFM